jgi:Asp/Glu/hydantoin racemase
MDDNRRPAVCAQPPEGRGVKKRLGLIRVLTTTDQRLLNRHGDLIMGWYPDFEVVSECIPDQSEGIHDDETEAMALPKVLGLARKMEKDGVRGIIVSCAGDPGVVSAGRELSIPVIGAGRAAACMARALEKPVGVLGITREVPKVIRDVLGSCFLAGMVPEGVASTLDLLKETGMEAAVEAGRELKVRGAGVILLACTGLSTIGADAKLREALGIPVIDPVRAEAAAAWLVLG